MPLALTAGAITSTNATVAVAGLAPDGTLDVQYSLRKDFQLGVSPLVLGVPRAGFTIPGLNPGTMHYIRARPRRASGALEAWSNTLGVRMLDGAARATGASRVMIEPAVLVVPEAVLSWADVGNTLAGFPLENLGFDGPVAWQSKNAASDLHVFVAELGGAEIDTIALLGSNASINATVTVKGGSTVAGADFTYGPVDFRASANLPGRPGYHALVRLPSVQKHRYWRVEIISDNFQDQFLLQHAVFGKNRVSKNHTLDKTESGIDLGTLDRTRGGNPVRTIGARMRRVDFDISVMSEAQFETNYADLDWRVGQTDPVLCVPNSKANAFLHDRILYGAIRGGKSVNVASPYYTRGFTIESII